MTDTTSSAALCGPPRPRIVDDPTQPQTCACGSAVWRDVSTYRCVTSGEAIR